MHLKQSLSKTSSCQRSSQHTGQPYLLVLGNWDDIHMGAVAPASMSTTASLNAAAQARRSCAQAIPIIIQSRFHRLRSKTSGPLRRARSSLSVVIHVLSWPPRFLCPLGVYLADIGQFRGSLQPFLGICSSAEKKPRHFHSVKSNQERCSHGRCRAVP